MHLEYQKDVDYLPSTNVIQFIIIGKIQIVYRCKSKTYRRNCLQIFLKMQKNSVFAYMNLQKLSRSKSMHQ